MSSRNSSTQLIAISTGTILRTFGILVAIGVLWLIRDVVLSVFTALLLAGVVYPLVKWAANHRIPKGVTVIVFYILLFGCMAVAVGLLIPAILREVGLFVGSYGSSFRWLNEGLVKVQEFSSRYAFLQNMQSGVTSIQAQLFQGASGVVTTIGSLFDMVVGVTIVLVLSFYMIVEESAVKTLFRNVIPVEHQEFASSLVWNVTSRLGDWLRGQLILGVVIGALYFIAYSVIGLPYAILLALFGGLLEFIPYVGPLISAIPAVIIAMTVSPLHGVVTLVAIFVIQQLENNIIVPKLMERAVGLNPIMSIIAVLIGAQLFGIVGALFAIPVATALSVVVTELYQYRQKRSREHEDTSL